MHISEKTFAKLFKELDLLNWQIDFEYFRQQGAFLQLQGDSYLLAR